MSTSLEKDLHSVYIDGEMPESFVSQYESIVSSSEIEKKKLEKMQRLHSLLQEDSGEKTVSDQFIEESFERLETKMRYSKTVSFASDQKSFVTPFVKYASSFAAAAAVFAVIFIPVHNNSLKNANQTALSAISIMKESSIEPVAQKDVVIDGNINKEDLPKVLAKEVPVIPEQKTVSATSLVSNSRSYPLGRKFRERFTAYDPFMPDFSQSITIPVPKFQEIGNNMDIMQNQNESGN